MTLRSNFLNKMNGPKENQKWAFGSVNVPYEEIYPELDRITDPNKAHFDSMDKLGEEIKSKIQAVCFSHSESCNGFANEMMWAQYANNHKGICIEIDVELFIKQNNHRSLFKFENIIYNPKKDEWVHWNKSLNKEENIDLHIRRNYETLFLTKSHYWEKEYEKRLLVISNDYCFFDISESLTGIYFGLSTDREQESTIEQLVNVDKTKLYRVYFEDNRLKRMEKRRGLQAV